MRRLLVALGLSVAAPGSILLAQDAVPAAPVLEAPPAAALPPSTIPQAARPWTEDEAMPMEPEVGAAVICVTPAGYCTFPMAASVPAGTACHCGSLSGVVN